ncbi:MAG: hypothetical protein L6R42_010550 [Xanthoria sp. 1 TBL-2021]|nr:MAG: hypothetical protein L6R42_010550 [Xanthoria sp. 1 TBL-2021]
MSCRISTVRAKIESAKLALNTIAPAQRTALKEALDSADHMIKEYGEHSTQTEFFSPTFSTLKMMERLAKERGGKRVVPASMVSTCIRTDPRLQQREPVVLRFHQLGFHLQSRYIHQLLMSMDLIRFSLEYTTTILSYTIRHPNQGYCYDHKTIGPEYHRFSTHKTALEDLLAVLKQQKSFPEPSPNWEGNIKQLSGKVGGWVKEMEWIDAAFTGGKEPLDYDF